MLYKPVANNPTMPPTAAERFTKPIQNLLLFTIACSPLFSLREFLRFSGFLVPQYAIYFNLAKDGLQFLIFIMCLVALFKSRKYPAFIFPFLLIFSLYTLLVAALSLYDPLMVLAGCRWSLPLLFIFLLCPFVDAAFMNRLVYVTAFLLLLTIGTQLYQVAHQQFRWGPSIYTPLLGRVPGFYELPSGTGFITCLSFFIVRYFYSGPLWIKSFLLLLAILSNFLLSISTTGLILMLIILIFPVLYRSKKYRLAYIIITLLFSVVLYFYLDTFNGRFSGDSKVSWNVRVQLMEDQVQQAQLVSTKFGNATNAVSVLKTAFGKPADAITGGGEAFYSPLLGNYGSLFFVLFICLLVYTGFNIFRYKSEARSLFFFIALLGALTVRITEIFPLNILISILAAYFIGNREPAMQQTNISVHPT